MIKYKFIFFYKFENFMFNIIMLNIQWIIKCNISEQDERQEFIGLELPSNHHILSCN